MFRSLFVAANVAALPAAAIAQAADDPVEVVRELMRLELWSISAADVGEDHPFSEASLARFFTPEFAAAYEAVMDRQVRLNEPLIDGDLILNSQEYCPIIEVAVGKLGAGANDAVVQVHFRSQWCWAGVAPEVTERVDLMQFRLVRGADGWKIDDFDSGGSVRQLFAELVGG